jgi:predicted protein tyrosine phosphatase
MRFHVVSREEACRWNPVGKPHVIISVTSPPDPEAEVKQNEHTRGVLRLGFHDLDQEPGPIFRKVYGEPVMFTEEMARAIDSFVAQHAADIETVIVHCDAGHSRSPAIAAALAHRYNEPSVNDWFFKHRTPNRFVYRTLLEVLMDEGTRKS